MRVTVIGTGSIALGTSAFLAERGHQPVLWSPSGRASPLAASNTIHAEGALTGSYPVSVAATCRDALQDADAVLIALPANYHRAAMDALAPHLQPRQTVLISGHLSFGALYLAKLLHARGLAVPIGAWGTTVTTGRRLAPDRVRISNIRQRVDVAAIPGRDADSVLTLCQTLFGDRFMLRDNLLAIALSNVNPQNHMAIALCNLTRMERGEEWRQAANTTNSVGRLIEALDQERLAIAAALDVSVRTVREHFALSFNVPAGPVGEMSAVLASRTDTIAPATLDTRYVLEDAPLGLYPTVLLGDITGHTATLHRSGLALFSALYGRDLAADNDLLPAIGFAQLSLDRLRHLASTGWD